MWFFVWGRGLPVFLLSFVFLNTNYVSLRPYTSKSVLLYAVLQANQEKNMLIDIKDYPNHPVTRKRGRRLQECQC